MHRAVSLFASWSRASVCTAPGLISHRCIHQLALSNALLRDFDQHIRESPQGVDQGTILRMLRHCAFGLRMEVPHKRVRTANQMWLFLKRNGTKMDASLHNSLLRVYISNNHKFSPSQFMDEMSTAGIAPNQGTLNLLLDSHCRQGNLTGAQSILKHMYDNGHTITEQVYASLITGHTQSGDMDEAWKMLDVMEENGFEPGIPSYTALLQGHANRGEIEQVRETLKKMIAKKLYPSHDVYIAILDSLSMGGHHSFLNEILDLIANKEWITHDLLQLAQTAAGRGEYESGMQIITTVLDEPSLVVNEHRMLIRASSTVFHHMIRSQLPAQTVFDNLKRLSAMELVLEQTWTSVLHSSYFFGSSEMVVETVKEMNAKGGVVKRHYLYPAIAQYINSDNYSGVQECLRLLNEFNLGIDQTVVLLLLASSWSSSNLFTLMKEIGLLDNHEERKKFLSHLCVLNLRIAADTVKEIGLSEAKDDFLNGLVDHCKIEKPDTVQLPKVFKMLYSSLPMDELTGCVEKCATELHRNSPVSCVESFLTGLVNEGITLSDDTYSLAERVSGSEFVEFLKQRFHSNYSTQEDLTLAKQESDKIIQFINSNRIGIAMEIYRASVNKGQTLTKYATCIVATVLLRTDTLAAEEMIREVERKGFVPNQYIRNAFISFYSKRGDVENTRRHFQLLVKSDIVPNEFTMVHLLAAYSFHGDADMVQDLIQNEVPKYGFKNLRVFLGQLVEAHMNNNNLEAAVVAIESSENNLPNPSSLYKLVLRLIERDEAKLLERVVALPQEKSYIYGMILEAHLMCGNTEQAMEIARGGNINSKLLSAEVICRRIASTGKVDSVRCMFQIMQELGMDTSQQQVHLLNAYAQLGDVEGMMSLQKEFTDSGTKPPKKFSSVLTKQLHRLGVTSLKQPVYNTEDASIS